MFRFLFFLILSICISSFEAMAFEFKKIDKIYSTLGKNHSLDTDFKKISLVGIESLNGYDKNYRVYCSNSKVYLYHKNKLIKDFNLPYNNNDSLAWKNTINDVLMTFCTHSKNIIGKEKKVELQVINKIAKNIDKYSRIEKKISQNRKIDYEFFDGIVYIKAKSFYDGLANDINRIVNSLSDINGLILDFRNNIGGNFNESLRVSDLFLDNALITYSVENGSTNYYTSQKGDILDGKKIVILVNHNTASAAEIVAGALGEQTRATVVGTRTFGKGSVQSVYSLENNNLYITSGYTYTPSGKRIDESGIVPQICTGISDSCVTSDNKDAFKDVLMAIKLIKNNLA